MKITMPVIGLCFLTLFSISAHAESAKPEANAALGLSAGWVVGNGIIYRHYFGDRFLQATFGATVDDKGDEAYIDVSASYASYLTKVQFSHLMEPLALKWIIGGEALYEDDQLEHTRDTHLGLGIGIDYGNVRRTGFLLSMDIIYTATFSGYSEPEFSSLMLRPAVSVLYNY